MNNVFQVNAAELERLRQRIYEAARHRSESPEALAAWKEASRTLFDAYDRLAFPGGLNRELERLQAGDPEAIEMAVRYLEADPWYFRSGYHKERMLRILKKLPLAEDQPSRLRVLILKHVRGRPRRETQAFCRIAPKITNAQFEAEIRHIAENSNRRAAAYAQQILQCLRSAGKVSDAAGE